MKSKIMQAVEDEFGEPFWDVVRGFAADGHSVHATAHLLGYSSDTPFRRLIQRHGMQIDFASAQESVFQIEARQARRGVLTEGLARAVQRASAANPCYHALTHNGTTDTVAGHARRAGIPVKTVRNRLRRRPGDMAYALSRSKHYTFPGTENHVWKTK